MKLHKFIQLSFCFVFFACSPQEQSENPVPPPLGSVLKVSPKLDSIVSENATFEIIAEGFVWAEGPLWLEAEQKLIFSDVPNNIIHEWTKEGGLKEYLKPSGSTGLLENGTKEGSNGLILDADGKLILCQHGDRRLARMMSPLSAPQSSFSGIAASYGGKGFNSPNDVVLSSKGDFYFTDPPYGLANLDDMELDFCGVYRVNKSGEVQLISKEMTRPNGIALSSDESKLYVANSDPKKANWMVFDLDSLGNVTKGQEFYNVTKEVPNAQGLPDGLKVDRSGNVFATGPGGVWIFSPEGKHLGTLQIRGLPTANCAFNADESVLYLTSKYVVIRVELMPKKA